MPCLLYTDNGGDGQADPGAGAQDDRRGGPDEEIPGHVRAIHEHRPLTGGHQVRTEQSMNTVLSQEVIRYVQSSP